MDHSSRLLDINVGKCRTVLRGHVDSVNCIHFKPYSNILGTCSADKTLSTWDARTSLCVQTCYGHNNSVNSCKFSTKGDKLASCDSNGIVKTWDLRMNK
jgi:WD40 repeat protein